MALDLSALKELVDKRAEESSVLRSGGRRAVTLATAEKPETGRLFQAIHGNTEHWHTVPDAGLMPLPAPATQASAEAGGGLGVDGRGDGTDGSPARSPSQHQQQGRLLHTMRRQQRVEVGGAWGDWLRLKGAEERWMLSRHDKYGVLATCIDGDDGALPNAASVLSCEDVRMLKWEVAYRVAHAPAVMVRAAPRADAAVAGAYRHGDRVRALQRRGGWVRVQTGTRRHDDPKSEQSGGAWMLLEHPELGELLTQDKDESEEDADWTLQPKFGM